ncbi:unnamed protein product [Moneuplotes crassus]|uniref:CCZ1/INTU/HSP4 first Longin domain-containing protein n=2 Tax=Euplotes crassus TaxID=5936 RepID=A0AAD1U397_EUPCR|nr:unnamed protein product [Moneuplotes crassus]
MYGKLELQMAGVDEREDQGHKQQTKPKAEQGLHIILYNPTLKPHESKRKNEDACQDAKILFFHPKIKNLGVGNQPGGLDRAIDVHEQRKQTGLCEGAIDFMSAFCQESDDYSNNPTETINTSLFTMCIKQVEPNMFLCLLYSHENLYTDNSDEHCERVLSSFTPTHGSFKEEDTQILNDTLKLYYDLFCLFHLSLGSVWERGQMHLANVLEDFTTKFDTFFFSGSCAKSYFNNSMYRGFPICPLDSKMHLLVQKYSHSLNVSKFAIFYQEYYVYGNIPNEETEILHTYLIGPFSEIREGYVSNWMDAGLQGKTTRILRKKPKNSSSQATESDFEEEKKEQLEHLDINYEEYSNEDDEYTDFCRVNCQGFVGTKQEKQGFITGPSVFKKIDRSSPEELKSFEIFVPTIYIKKDFDSNKSYTKLLVMKFLKMTFVYLLETEHLEESQYSLLYDQTKLITETLSSKISSRLHTTHLSHMRASSNTKFFYFNSTNLALKICPSITIDHLTTEIRHYLNIIKSKFDSNELLKEYKITADSYWVIGVRMEARLVVLLVPVGYSYGKMEKMKEEVLEEWFGQFVM